VSCPNASECTIGLRPSPSAPQSHESSTNSRMNWFSNSSKYIQFGSTKIHQWKARKLNNGSLGAVVFVVPVSFLFLKIRGKMFG